MEHLTVILTKRRLNPISLLIRWAIPMSRVTLARSSHAIAVDGDHAIEAHMVYGVRRVPLAQAIAGAQIVGRLVYAVPDAERGLAWFRSQVCTYAPAVPRWVPGFLRDLVGGAMLMLNNNYDFKGAFGLGVAPDREWQDPDCWFCYEAIARMLREAGYDVFADTGYITEATLLAVKRAA